MLWDAFLHSQLVGFLNMVVSPTSLFANVLFANVLNHFAYMLAGLSERFEVDRWVVKVSGQSRDILF